MKDFFILPMIIMTVTSIGLAQDAALEKELSRADSLYDNFDEAEALELYTSILNHNPDNYTALWRTSFLYSRIGYRLEGEQQRSYYDRAIALAKRALNVDSTDTQSNFVASVALGRKAMVSGARERVEASRDIKKYAERAIQLDSTNAGAWHVLGRWHFKVANLNFVERLAANTLFGGIPKASETKAMRSIEKAIELNSENILYYYDLARIYKHLGKDQQAIGTCQKALKKEPMTPDDPKWLDKCRNLLNALR
ncbi:hypothetical protein NC796_04175 [Aliifodinibius sp. S!AR15-10]|nr:hypothetical protein [Aliifodinibius sp. S!AR15-10]